MQYEVLFLYGQSQLRVHHLICDVWNVHPPTLNSICHLNAQSSCLRRFCCSSSQPALVSTILTNIISKFKTILLSRLFMNMLNCVLPTTHLMDTSQQSFHCVKWMHYTQLYFLPFNRFLHLPYSLIVQLLSLLKRLWSEASLNS